MTNICKLGEVTTGGGPCDCKRMARLIVRFSFNDLKPSERRKVEAHLPKCPRCMGRHKALAAAYGVNVRGSGSASASTSRRTKVAGS